MDRALTGSGDADASTLGYNWFTDEVNRMKGVSLGRESFRHG
ncbi:hypothetical protein Poly51_01420 [Rubripirellula tenax]|uniref:Uncharacterized protein n=1 Tax=Rubripirellula tenax TaxID=2528015 RepID=A0A5C6FIJ5_9BACT|nr:hypothetical protein Poly51_01420 [Rubripirellula tenax]